MKSLINKEENMKSFVHVSHITILGYTKTGLQEGQHTKRLAETNKGYSTFKNVISSVKINRKSVNVVCKEVKTRTHHIL